MQSCLKRLNQFYFFLNLRGLRVINKEKYQPINSESSMQGKNFKEQGFRFQL